MAFSQKNRSFADICTEKRIDFRLEEVIWHEFFAIIQVLGHNFFDPPPNSPIRGGTSTTSHRRRTFHCVGAATESKDDNIITAAQLYLF